MPTLERLVTRLRKQREYEDAGIRRLLAAVAAMPPPRAVDAIIIEPVHAGSIAWQLAEPRSRKVVLTVRREPTTGELILLWIAVFIAAAVGAWELLRRFVG
jgi:hypothetical protein